jgi:hypothetical protein
MRFTTHLKTLFEVVGGGGVYTAYNYSVKGLVRTTKKIARIRPFQQRIISLVFTMHFRLCLQTFSIFWFCNHFVPPGVLCYP